MQNDDPTIRKITALFGEKAYPNGKLDRKEIARLVFRDATLLKRLNRIVHPAVARDFEKWTRNYRKERYLLKEAALIFETGSYKTLDRTLLVYAPGSLRINRVLARDPHRTREDVENIVNKQLTDTKKETLADFIIYNDEKQSVIEQVLKVHGELIKFNLI